MTESTPLYDALVGFNYGKNNSRVDEGDSGVKLPADVAKVLLEQGAIKLSKKKAA